MIFVAVGTHEQPMNRLVNAIDEIAESSKEECIIQYGTSKIPRFANGKKTFPHSEMQALMKRARVVICQGGPGLIIESLVLGKNPIVVPRRKEFGEHVDNHQVQFVQKIEKIWPIKYVLNIQELGELIENPIVISSNRENVKCTQMSTPSIFDVLDDFTS